MEIWTPHGRLPKIQNGRHRGNTGSRPCMIFCTGGEWIIIFYFLWANTTCYFCRFYTLVEWKKLIYFDKLLFRNPAVGSRIKCNWTWKAKDFNYHLNPHCLCSWSLRETLPVTNTVKVWCPGFSSLCQWSQYSFSAGGTSSPSLILHFCCLYLAWTLEL